MKNINNSEEHNIINIKTDNKEQIISKFSYDEDDKLNKELSEFIIDKAKSMPLKRNIKLNFYSSYPINQSQVESTLKNHFREEYIESKHDIRRLNIVSIIMLILGIISLTVLILANRFFNYFYFTTILEIASWVFVWESVDISFIQRSKIKHRCMLFKNLYNAKIEIIITD